MPSAQSPISISNIALSQLGANLITSFEDDTTESKLCKANYEPLRNAELETYEWSFATRRRQYGITVPAIGAGTAIDAYPGIRIKIQSDTIRILQVASDRDFRDTDPIQWSVEESHIIVDRRPIFVRELFRLKETADFSEAFAQALAARMAYELCLPITESLRKFESLFTIYTQKLNDAKTLDSMQGRSKRIRSNWMRSSRSRTSNFVR